MILIFFINLDSYPEITKLNILILNIVNDKMRFKIKQHMFSWLVSFFLYFSFSSFLVCGGWGVAEIWKLVGLVELQELLKLALETEIKFAHLLSYEQYGEQAFKFMVWDQNVLPLPFLIDHILSCIDMRTILCYLNHG